MGDRTFEATIEQHIVHIDVGPLADWEAMGWLEPSALVVGAALVATVSVWGWVGGRTKLAKFVGCLSPALLAGLFAVVVGAAAHFSLGPADSARGNSLWLFPELRERFSGIGAVALATLGGGLGTSLGVMLDVPAWLDKRTGPQLGRLALAALTMALGVGAFVAGADVRAFEESLSQIGPLPRIQPADRLVMHVGQSRVISVTDVTALGLRRQRRSLFILEHAPRVIVDPGSERDLLALEEREDYRVELEVEQWAAWGGDEAATLEAPPSAGAFQGMMHFEQGPVHVDAPLEGLAIDDTPDPLFPLALGGDRIYARARRTRTGHVHDAGTLRVHVVREEVVEGFRQLVVEITDTPGPPEVGAAPDPDAPVVRTETLILVPWEGTLRDAPHPEADRFVEAVPSPEDSGPHASLAMGEGTACRVPILDGAQCMCGDEAGLAGPRRCVVVRGAGLGDLALVGLGIVTAGITWAAGALPGSGPVTELRLVEADGVVVDTPSQLVTAESRDRRRSRAR